MKEVFIVFNIDTEGPATETSSHIFNRVRNIYGLSLEPSLKNLRRLQNGDIEGLDEETKLGLRTMLAPDRISYLNNWEQIDEMLDRFMSAEWRALFPDSAGNGFVYSFYVRDLVGYDFNPRRMAMGYHQVYDFYKEKIESLGATDVLYWHFHSPGFIKHAYLDGLNALSSDAFVQNLSRRVIDRMDFPACFRPGMDHIRPDLNFLLEMWIPFDYSNQAVEPTAEELSQKDNAPGRFGDWRNAPRDWVIYHPDLFDYQKNGSMKRYVARCLYTKGRMRVINQREVDKAFERADRGLKTVMSFICHDCRDMTEDIAAVVPLIKAASEKYPSVKFYYSNAVDAVRKALDLKSRKPAELRLHWEDNVLIVESDKELWGPQPFFCFKTWDQRYHYDNLDKQSATKWSYTFDWQTVNLKAVENIGLATNDDYGNTTLARWNAEQDTIDYRYLNNEAL